MSCLWLVKDLSTASITQLQEKYSNVWNLDDNNIYCNLQYHQLYNHNKYDAEIQIRNWLTRLSNSKQWYVKQLQKNAFLCHIHDSLLFYIDLWSSFQVWYFQQILKSQFYEMNLFQNCSLYCWLFSDVFDKKHVNILSRYFMTDSVSFLITQLLLLMHHLCLRWKSWCQNILLQISLTLLVLCRVSLCFSLLHSLKIETSFWKIFFKFQKEYWHCIHFLKTEFIWALSAELCEIFFSKTSKIQLKMQC